MSAPPGLSRTRAGVAPPAVHALVASGRVPPGERERLAATIGVLLRTERLAAGYGTRRAAAAIGCERSTVRRLESGQLRPREVTLRCIAAAYRPDDPRPLAQRLIAAAGASLRPDTDGAVRRRIRRANAAILAGRRRLPSDLERRLVLHRRADAMHRRVDALLAAPGALDDPDVLGQALDLHTEASRLREQAGPPITIRIGKNEITAGWGT